MLNITVTVTEDGLLVVDSEETVQISFEHPVQIISPDTALTINEEEIIKALIDQCEFGPIVLIVEV